MKQISGERLQDHWSSGISNHPRETSTNQILIAREHTKMEVDIKSSLSSLKYVCNDGNSVYLIIISELYMYCKCGASFNVYQIDVNE